MKRIILIAILILWGALAEIRAAECDNAIEVTENRRVVLPERVRDAKYARRGLWLKNIGNKGILCAAGAKTKRRLLPGEVWEEKSETGYLEDDLEFEEVSCVTSEGVGALRGCDY